MRCTDYWCKTVNCGEPSPRSYFGESVKFDVQGLVHTRRLSWRTGPFSEIDFFDVSDGFERKKKYFFSYIIFFSGLKKSAT